MLIFFRCAGVDLDVVGPEPEGLAASLAGDLLAERALVVVAELVQRHVVGSWAAALAAVAHVFFSRSLASVASTQSHLPSKFEHSIFSVSVSPTHLFCDTGGVA